MTAGRNKHSPKGTTNTIKLDRAREMNESKNDQYGRDTWWRGSLNDSPNPGCYHIRDFIEEAALNPIRLTYGFRGTGRNTPLQWGRKGDLLLPGAYSYTDCIQEALQRPAFYPFKNCPRPESLTLGIRDKDVNISPWHYDLMEKPIPKSPCKHVMFRSVVPRQTFLPRDGPAPGQYEIKECPTRAVTSCFRSTVPRLHSMRTKTPGPGTYEVSRLKIQRPGTEASMGRAHGLFFRNAF